MRIAVADIGGTNARFALADIAGGKVISLDEPTVLAVKDHAGLADAWRTFGALLDENLPRHAAFGLAGPVTGGPVRFINSPWVVDPAALNLELGLETSLVLNDFGAMAHAADALGPSDFAHVCGPDVALPKLGAISVIGPGTGLGVAVLQRRELGAVILETEGAHVHFAALDPDEARVSAAITAQHGRTSIERVVSGPGLGAIIRTFDPADRRGDASLWIAALDGHEPHALALFLAAYGAACGDLSLAHGSMAVVLAGGLTTRLHALLSRSDFPARFCDKGRYRARMESIPVKLIVHPQPGLLGVAAAYAREFP
jgi:glucokinase